MAIAIALPGFSGLGHSVTPTFLSRIRFYLQLSLRFPKMNKQSMWEVQKLTRYLVSVSAGRFSLKPIHVDVVILPHIGVIGCPVH